MSALWRSIRSRIAANGLVEYWLSLGLPGFLTALLGAASAMTALAGSSGVALVLAAGAIVIIGLSLTTWLGSPPIAITPLTRFQVCRVLLVMAIAICARTGLAVTLVLASLTLLLTVCETLLRRLCLLGVPYAANFPGVRLRTGPIVKPGFVFFANLAALILYGVAVMLPGAWAVGAVMLGTALVFETFAFADAVDRIVQRHRFERAMDRNLRELAPAFLLHWQAPEGTAYQVSMWLPYLKRLERPFFILARTEVNFGELVEMTDVPIILRKGLEELDPVITPSLRVAFYVNTAVRNSHVIRYGQLTHIQLNHGDSDKAPSYNSVFRMYDKNFVAGQAAIDRFEQHGIWMPRKMFVIVGRPQVEDIRVAERPIGQIASKTVLYAPTWAGFYADSNYSSLPAGADIVRCLLDRGCTVIFRPHPYTSRNTAHARAAAEIRQLLADDARSSGRNHRFGPQAEETMSIVECFNESDALISDVSSVVADYLYSEKPFAMVTMLSSATRFRDEFPISRASYVIDCSSGRPRDLATALDDLLEADPAAARRHELKVYYLGGFPPSECVGQFVAEASKFLS